MVGTKATAGKVRAAISMYWLHTLILLENMTSGVKQVFMQEIWLFCGDTSFYDSLKFQRRESTPPIVLDVIMDSACVDVWALQVALV